MSRAREGKITHALSRARERGIRIERGAQFDWCSGEQGLPRACSALGAVLLYLVPDLCVEGPRDWHLVREHLDVGTYWIYRFHMGFDRHRVLKRRIEVKGKSKKKKYRWIEDSTSKNAYALGRRWCR